VPEQRTRRAFGPFSLPLLNDGGCGGQAKVSMLGGRCLAARPHAMEELRESSGSRGFGRRRENGGGDGGDRCKRFAGKKFLQEGMARFCRDRCGWSKRTPSLLVLP
jgi:hypothetical protein